MRTKILIAFISATVICVMASAQKNGQDYGVNREWYRELFSGNISQLREIIDAGQTPDGSDILPDFELLPFFDHMSRKKNESSMDMKEKGEKNSSHPPMGQLCGQRIYAYLVPDTTGEYVFYISACGRGELYLSPDERKENAESIIRMMGPSKVSVYGRADQKSKPIRLEAGKKYYIEAIMAVTKLWEPDHLSVAWSKPSESRKTAVSNDDILDSIANDIGAGNLSVIELITGKYLRPVKSLDKEAAKQRENK